MAGSGSWTFLDEKHDVRGPEYSGKTEYVDIPVPEGSVVIVKSEFWLERFLDTRVTHHVTLKPSGEWTSADTIARREPQTVVLWGIRRLGDPELQYVFNSVAFRDTPGVTSFRAHYFAISTFEYRNIAVLVKSTTKVGIVTIGSTPDEWIVTDGSHYVTKYARGKVVLKVHGPEPAVVEIRYNVVTDRGVKQERARFRVGDEGIIIADPDVYGFVKLSFVLIEGPGAIVEYDVIAFKPEQPPEKPPEQPPEPREPSEPRGPTNYPNIWDIIKDLLRRVLRDEEPVSIEPFVTKSLVALNTAIFLAVAANLEDAVMTWGLIPIAVLAGEWIRLLTHMYLHADYLQHLAGNMLFLYVFGDNVEERTTWRYVLYYHLFGLAAAGAFIMQALAQPEMMMVPAVGASGAIAGVLGYYFVTFPNAKVVFMGRTMPAWAFGSLWFLQQIALIFMSTNIAWSAHIGGFLAGVALAALDRRREARAD